jgi:hypothetical protein
MKRSDFLSIIGWVLLLSSWLLTAGSVPHLIMNLAAVICFSTSLGMRIGDKKGASNETSIR